MPWRLFEAARKNKTDLRILRTSCQIYEDVLAEIKLYEDLTFVFVVEWRIENLAYARRRGVFNLPYKMLKRVRVEIEEALDAMDRNQKMRIAAKLVDVSVLLEGVDLMNFEISMAL
ncbi:MAG: hypothetical protein M1818_005532 [Claussenomyces sp. TS43310]|nr:MAG: hypothetical protein M1818_005532 [Claussenomyces sp. TS43310]